MQGPFPPWGAQRVLPFPSVSPPGAGVPRAALCLSFPAGAAGTDLCMICCSRPGWALGRPRLKAHEPPEGRGAKLPPGTAQSCLGESDRGDLFPRAPSWRGAGCLDHPACPQWSGHLPTPPSDPCPLLGDPQGMPSWVGAAHTHGFPGAKDVPTLGAASVPPLPAIITVITKLLQPPQQSESDRVSRERVNQCGTQSAPSIPVLDEANHAGFGVCPEPQHHLRGMVRTGQSIARSPHGTTAAMHPHHQQGQIQP